MSTVTNSAITKIAAVTAGLAMFASFALVAPAQAASLTNAQVQSILSMISAFGADSTVIANVRASLTGGTPSSTTSTTSTTGSTTTTSSCNFTMSLTNGSKGSDVTCLQTALINAGYTIPAGATGYFGNQTKSAVAAWQKANNIAPAVGYFGSISRSHWNLGVTTTTGTTGGTTTGTVSTTGGTTTGGTTALTGNGLKVAVAAGSPNGTVLVMKQGIANLGEFTFSNPTSAAIKVTNLTFNRIGVSNDNTLTNIYLYNGVNRITDSAGISNSQFSYSNTAGLFTVPAGSTYTVAVRSDIANTTSGQQVGVQLTSVGSNGTLDSSVSFPVVGGLQTISAASLASVTFSTNTLPAINTSLSPTADYTVWQNTISVSTNPVKLSMLRLTNLGSIDASDVQNLRLYVDGTQVGTAVPQMNANRTVSFDLSASPVTLSTSNHIIKVIANVVGGSSRTLTLSLQRSSDAMFVDTQLNQPVTLSTGNTTTSFSAATAGVQTIDSVSSNSGVTVTKAAASPINDIPVGASNVKLASFNFLASGEAVKVRDLYVYASSELANGKIMVNGIQVGSTKTISGASGTATDFSLGSSLIIPAGKVTVVDIYGDTKDSNGVNISSGTTVQVTLKASTSNGQGQSSLNSTPVPGSNTSGNALTVSNSALTATKYTGYGNQTMVPGTNGARLGSFTLSAGSTEGINVNTIAMKLSSSTDVTNLTLKDHATGQQIGSVVNTPSGTGNTFSVNLNIPESSTKTIDVYGNILSNAANNDLITATLTTSTSGTGSVTSTNSSLLGDVALQTVTVGTGSLTAALGASNLVNTVVLAGSSKVQVGDYTFSALNTPYTIQKLEITVPNSSATSTTGVTIQYKDANGNTQKVTQALNVIAANPTATSTFSGLSMFVPKNDSADLQVFVGVPTISNGATSGAAITATLVGNAGFQAVNSAGNATTTIGATGASVSSASNGYGTVYVRKSVPTFAMQTVGTTPVAAQALYRVNVTADASGAIDLGQLSFKVATSTGTGGITLGAFSLYDTANNTVALGSANAVANSTGIVTIPFTNPQQIGAGQMKTYELRSANVPWTTAGQSITISLAQDAASATNDTASTIKSSSNTTWSDRSATDHATLGFGASDWTNGYLLKDFVNDVTSFNHS